MTRIPNDCLSRERIDERIKRRQTATIVYQYRSAYRRRDCILYPPLSPLNDRGIIPELIDEHHCRVRSAIPLSFRREVFLGVAWKQTGFCDERADISLNSISLYRRSTSEILAGSSFDRPTPMCVRLCIIPASPFVYILPCIPSQVWLATGCVNACGSRSRRCARRDCGRCINPARM